jgi:DNA-binding MarR family transcriptional regulator
VEPLYELGLYMKAGQREFDRQTTDVMRSLGLTAPQADAILVIGQAEPLSLKELGGLLIAEAGHPSRLIDRLVEAGLVERRAASDDRRRVVLSLSEEGRRIEKEVRVRRDNLLALGRQVIGERDLEPVLEVLRELVQYSAYAELIARRIELWNGEGQASDETPGGPDSANAAR